MGELKLENLKERDHLEYTGIYGNIISKMDVKRSRIRRCGLDTD
jgi:hypothetical protein